MSSRRRAAAILAVDGGNSKLDAVLIGADGTVLGTARGHGASFSPGDHENSFQELTRTVQRAARAAATGWACTLCGPRSAAETCAARTPSSSARCPPTSACALPAR